MNIKFRESHRTDVILYEDQEENLKKQRIPENPLGQRLSKPPRLEHYAGLKLEKHRNHDSLEDVG